MLNWAARKVIIFSGVGEDPIEGFACGIVKPYMMHICCFMIKH